MSESSEGAERRDWNWDRDGELVGLYVETRQVTVRSGPSAGQEKIVFDFHVGLDDELVSVWETTVLRSKFRQELRKRHKPDFEPGEQITIRPTGKKGENSYRDFDIEFEHAAPKPTAADLLEGPADPNTDDADPEWGEAVA